MFGRAIARGAGTSLANSGFFGRARVPDGTRSKQRIGRLEPFPDTWAFD